MKTILCLPMFVIVLFTACTSSKNVASMPSLEPPTEKALDYNFNLNQARSIVKYTSSHKKARQKMSEHNREVQNDNWIKLNATNKNPDTRNKNGQFKFYKNN